MHTIHCNAVTQPPGHQVHNNYISISHKKNQGRGLTRSEQGDMEEAYRSKLQEHVYLSFFFAIGSYCVSLPCWPGTPYVDQAGFELIVPPTLPPQCWD